MNTHGWSYSAYSSYLPDTTDLADIIKWLTSTAENGIVMGGSIRTRPTLSRKYRVVVDDIPLTEFDLDNLWILESYL